jgi:hypothetical protein
MSVQTLRFDRESLTNAVNSWGLEMSPGVSEPALSVLACLKEGVGVLLLSSALGVDTTFKGRAEDDIEYSPNGSN